jgi:hypothetical protein
MWGFIYRKQFNPHRGQTAYQHSLIGNVAGQSAQVGHNDMGHLAPLFPAAGTFFSTVPGRVTERFSSSDFCCSGLSLDMEISPWLR